MIVFSVVVGGGAGWRQFQFQFERRISLRKKSSLRYLLQKEKVMNPMYDCSNLSCVKEIYISGTKMKVTYLPSNLPAIFEVSSKDLLERGAQINLELRE